jgi:hypothetical protein
VAGGLSRQGLRSETTDALVPESKEVVVLPLTQA